MCHHGRNHQSIILHAWLRVKSAVMRKYPPVQSTFLRQPGYLHDWQWAESEDSVVSLPPPLMLKPITHPKSCGSTDRRELRLFTNMCCEPLPALSYVSQGAPQTGHTNCIGSVDTIFSIWCVDTTWLARLLSILTWFGSRTHLWYSRQAFYPLPAAEHRGISLCSVMEASRALKSSTRSRCVFSTIFRIRFSWTTDKR